MAQQTAVEWLIKEFSNILDELGFKPIQHLLLMPAIKQAKEMEKQQIIDAHLTGLIYPLEIEATKQAEDYYTETYRK
jgi:hypothetical protein